jgi:hypothetical protein
MAYAHGHFTALCYTLDGKPTASISDLVWTLWRREKGISRRCWELSDGSPAYHPLSTEVPWCASRSGQYKNSIHTYNRTYYVCCTKRGEIHSLTCFQFLSFILFSPRIFSIWKNSPTNVLLLRIIISRQMFQRLMSLSSGDIHCEERWTSMWFIRAVLCYVVHTDTVGSTGSNSNIHINNTSLTLDKTFKICTIMCTCH